MDNFNNNNNNIASPVLKHTDYNVPTYKMIVTIILLGYFASKLIHNLLKQADEPDQTCYGNLQYDLMGVLLFGSIIYLFNSYLSKMELIHSVIFIFTYIIGLSFGQLYNTYRLAKNKNGDSVGFSILTSLYYMIIVLVIAISLISNYGSPSAVGIYVSCIILFGGVLYYLNTYNTEFRDGDDVIALFTNKFLLTVPMLAFMTNLLFLYSDSSNTFITIIQQCLSGILLGVFVSSVAIFGIREMIPERATVDCTNFNDNKTCKGKPFKYGKLFENSKLATTALILLIIAFVVITVLAGMLIFNRKTSL